MTWRAFLTLLCTLLGLRGAKASDLPVLTEGVSRRAFLVALGVSAGALATASFELDVPLVLDEPFVNWHGQVLTVEWITREALRILEQNIRVARTINRDYNARFLG